MNMSTHEEIVAKQVDFLHERIDEIEAVAVAVVEKEESLGNDIDDVSSIEYSYDEYNGESWAFAQASPAFIFAQCDAQREVIRAALASYSGAPDGHDAEEWMRSAVLASLAVAYCDHEDYDPAWAEEL